MKVLQFVDAGNLCVSGSSVNSAFFSLFPEFEDLVGNLVVGFFVVGLFNKLLLKFHKLLINTIGGDCSRSSDDRCDILL